MVHDLKVTRLEAQKKGDLSKEIALEMDSIFLKLMSVTATLVATAIVAALVATAIVSAWVTATIVSAWVATAIVAAWVTAAIVTAWVTATTGLWVVRWVRIV